MRRIVSTPAEAFHNITRFEAEVEKSAELRDRLPYARAWYAYRESRLGGGNTSWSFGPSKFVGYEGLDAETYLKDAQEIDGRQTEAQLRSFFTIVDPTHPQYAELRSALVAFLAKYGKVPSTKTRINIYRGIKRVFPTEQSADNAHAQLVRVIVAAAATLPSEHLKEVHEAIEGMWSS